MIPIWFDCPMCGEPDSAPEMGFCGKCEQEYQKSEAERAKYEEEKYLDWLSKQEPGAEV